MLIEVLDTINKNLPYEYMFNYNPICEKYLNDKYYNIEDDPHIYPLDFTIHRSKEVVELARYANRTIFQPIVDCLINDKGFTITESTSRVKLRIVINMIDKLQIPEIAKIYWRNHIFLLFKFRFAECSRYYISTLPFQTQGYSRWVDYSSLIFMPMTQEVITLVEQAKQGSESAFTKLYKLYKSNIWFTIYNIVKNTDIADDLTSVVFTKAYQKLNSYVQHISFEMWLKTIAVNSSIDYIRRNKKEQLNNYMDDEDNTIQLENIEKSPEEQLVLQEKVKIVERAILTLRKKYRDLINARIEGLSYNEISEKFALPESKVKSDLNKARQRLKQKIANIY